MVDGGLDWSYFNTTISIWPCGHGRKVAKMLRSRLVAAAEMCVVARDGRYGGKSEFQVDFPFPPKLETHRRRTEMSAPPIGKETSQALISLYISEKTHDTVIFHLYTRRSLTKKLITF